LPIVQSAGHIPIRLLQPGIMTFASTSPPVKQNLFHPWIIPLVKFMPFSGSAVNVSVSEPPEVVTAFGSYHSLSPVACRDVVSAQATMARKSRD
jgi:hypothetical protein